MVTPRGFAWPTTKKPRAVSDPPGGARKGGELSKPGSTDETPNAPSAYTRQNRVPQAEIAGRLRVSINKVNDWLSTILKREKEEREAKMWGMWLSCHAQSEIADAVGLEQHTVSENLRKISENYPQEDSDIFRSFKPKIYTPSLSDMLPVESGRRGNVDRSARVPGPGSGGKRGHGERKER